MNIILIILLLGILAVFNAVVPLPGFNFFVPLFGTFMSFQVALTFITSYFLMTSIVIAVLFRKYLKKEYVIGLIPSSLIGALIGSFISSSLNEIVITVVILCFVLYFTIIKTKRALQQDSQNQFQSKNLRAKTTLVGLISGFLQGGGFGGGDVRNGYLYANNLSAQEVRAVTAMVGIFIFVVSLITRAIGGHFELQNLWVLIGLIPVTVAATLLGRHITTKLSTKVQNIIIITLMITSVILISVKLWNLM